jgi:glycosyltransferase involved in cell wall biosynthesis
MRWMLVTGEYPPVSGGVADYTYQIAHRLVEQGDEVEVIAKVAGAGPRKNGDVIVRPINLGCWPLWAIGMKTRVRIAEKADVLLLEYVPQLYGWKAMNLPFTFLMSRLQGYPLWVHFHECFVEAREDASFRERVLAVVTQWMARLLAVRADRVITTIPEFARRLEVFRKKSDISVIGVPSNLPIPQAECELEAKLVGHFSTYSPWIAEVVESALVVLFARHDGSRALLMGRNHERFVVRFRERHPEFASRVSGCGTEDPHGVVRAIQRCEVMLQPYPDGITGRRGTAMASLSLGKAMVTTEGHLSEEFWRMGGVVRLESVRDSEGLANGVGALLDDPAERQRLGREAKEFYQRNFSIERIVDKFRRLAAEDERAKCGS